MTYKEKRRDDCVLFLDECFGRRDTADRLKDAGYKVEPFRDHFKRSDGGMDQGIKDPEVIQLCHAHGWILVTSDRNMQYTHVEQIKKTSLLILATAHNAASDIDAWVTALIALKAQLLRLHKNQPRPCFATFSRSGTISSKKTISPDAKTRRMRSK